MNVFLIISLTVLLANLCSTTKRGNYSTVGLLLEKHSPKDSETYGMGVELNKSDPRNLHKHLEPHKCCSDDEVLDNETMVCIGQGKNKQVSNMTTYHLEGGDFLVKNLAKRCLAYPLEPQHDLWRNLSIFLKNRTDLGPDDYCLERFPEENPRLMFMCFKTQKYKCEGMAVVFIVGIISSTVCLGISIFIYSLFSDLRNLYGRSLMCYMISVLFIYVLYAVILESRESISGNPFCTALGFMQYEAVLSTFFWLNVVCIDIYIAFRTFRRCDREMRINKKNLFYIIYAVGGPILIVVIVMFLELYPRIPETIYKPEFYKTCWFKERRTEMVYLVAPVGVLLGCNLVLFLLTARNIYTAQKGAKMLRIASRENLNKNVNRTKFRLYFKLSTVMGTSWITEMALWLSECNSCPCIFIHGTTMYQGFIISIILVCNKRVKELLIKRFLPILAAKISFKKNDSKEERLESTSEKGQQGTSVTDNTETTTSSTTCIPNLKLNILNKFR